MTDKPKALISADPANPDWRQATGQGLLSHTNHIPSVERDPAGITFHANFADEVRAALTTAGYTITETRLTPTPRNYRNDPTACWGCEGKRRRRPGHTYCATCAAGPIGTEWNRLHRDDPRYKDSTPIV